jgi:hypothetical protein
MLLLTRKSLQAECECGQLLGFVQARFDPEFFQALTELKELCDLFGRLGPALVRDQFNAESIKREFFEALEASEEFLNNEPGSAGSA